MSFYGPRLIGFNQEKRHIPWLDSLIIPRISTVSDTDGRNGLMRSDCLFLTQTAKSD